VPARSALVSEFRELDAARLAHEQGHAELVFQAPDNLAHRGLRRGERHGGGADAAVLGYGFKIAKMVRVHRGASHSDLLWSCTLFRFDPKWQRP